jgi:hypothetical protein
LWIAIELKKMKKYRRLSDAEVQAKTDEETEIRHAAGDAYWNAMELHYGDLVNYAGMGATDERVLSLPPPERTFETEHIIAKSAQYAYYYAGDIIQGRWPEGEKSILSNDYYILKYSIDVLKQRWKLGERVLRERKREHNRFIFPGGLYWIHEYELHFGITL